LIQVIVAISWTCPGAATELTEPGSCPDGSARAKKYAARPHGNHNPQHGGQFFMAADNWHHLEGAYPRAGVFRMYLYDDYTKPLKLAEFKGVTGRVVSQQTFDPATLTTKESAAFKLVPTPGGRYLEAKVGTMTLPAQLTPGTLKPDWNRVRLHAFATYWKNRSPTHRHDARGADVSAEPAPMTRGRVAEWRRRTRSLGRRRSRAGAVADPRHHCRDAHAAADADRSDSRLHRQRFVRRDLRAGVPGEGPRARPRRARQRVVLRAP
jgi:hypothetical protein